MSVKSLNSRIDAIFQQLMASYSGGQTLSSSSKGTERELFVSHLLAQVFPPHYRFGSGDIIDLDGRQSGQLDIVFETSHGFSFPMHSGGPRLFLAENVACAIEVKSNLADQWNDVVATADKLAMVHRGPKANSDDMAEALVATFNKNRAIKTGRPVPSLRIPLFVVGFKGWANVETAERRVQECEFVDGALMLDSRVYVDGTSKAKPYQGARSLVAFLERIRQSSIFEFSSYLLASYGYFRDASPVTQNGA